MSVCLNPYESHSTPETIPARLVCPERNCGFLLAGATINRWRVTTLFGRGPLADLYLAVEAEQSDASRSVMLVKVMRAPLTGPLQRLDQQLDHLMALHHPHIQPLRGVGWTSPAEMLYLLSAYEEYGGLARYVDVSLRLPPLAIASIVRQVAGALQYAHDRQVVHGRIKPENCLLVAPATVQVSDLYYSILSDEARKAITGSVAPEQAYGQAEPASDQYALAYMTYQLLAGQPPFTDTEARTAFVTHEPLLPRTLSAFRPGLSPLVDRTLSRALSLRAHDRFPSVEVFALALQAALEAGGTGPASPRLASPFPPISDVGAARTPSEPSLFSSPRQPALVCQLPGHTSAASVLRWAPDGYLLASAGSDEGIRLWQIQRRIGTPLATLVGHSTAVHALAWSPDGALVASGGADATVRIWRPATASAEAAWWGHADSVTALDWSPDGRHIVSGGADRTIRVWNRQGDAVSTWQVHRRGGVTALACSPDGRLLASGGADRVIHIWDLTRDAAVTTLEAHTDEIRHLAWHPQGGLVASFAGKKDTRVCIWHAQHGQLIATLSGHSREIAGLVWSRDGTWLTTVSADGTLRQWDMRLHVGEPIGAPFHLSGSPVSMAGTPGTGLLAIGLADLLIQVMQL